MTDLSRMLIVGNVIVFVIILVLILDLMIQKNGTNQLEEQ